LEAKPTPKLDLNALAAKEEDVIYNTLQYVTGSKEGAQHMLIDLMFQTTVESRTSKGEYNRSAFVSGIPVPAFVIFRCIMKWDIMHSEAGMGLLNYIPRAMNNFILVRVLQNCKIVHFFFLFFRKIKTITNCYHIGSVLALFCIIW